MANTIFWAWQSDLDGSLFRHFIRRALDAAIGRMVEHLDLEDRPELDHDTKGIPGLAAIADSIFAKIAVAGLFVADLTPVARGEGGKFVANPNVLIELGYAKHALGPDRIILVWNTAFPGTLPTDLPFDLRHRRAPIGYRLTPEMTGSEGKRVADQLANDLAAAIAGAWTALPAPTLATLPWQSENGADPSIWFDPSQPLSINDSGDVDDRTVPSGPRNYARILPSSWPTGKRVSELRHTFALNRTSGLDWGRIKGGLLTYAGNRQQRTIRTGSMWFPATGEIWGFGCDPVHGDPPGIVSGFYLMARWAEFISSHEKLLSEAGGAGPFHVKLGIAGIIGTRWAKRMGAGPATAESGMAFQFTYTTNEELRTGLWQAWELLTDLYGLDPGKEDQLDEILVRGS